MPSEIILVKDETAAWAEHKREIMNFVADLAKHTQSKIEELRPRLHDIYNRKLWKHGGYASLQEFCEKVLGYTRQRFHQILNEEATKKALGFDGQTSNCLTFVSNRATAELSGLPVEKAVEIVKEAQRVNPKKKPSAHAIKKAKARLIDPETNEPIRETTPEPILDDEPPPPPEAATRGFQSLYMELIMSVESVFPNETRHQTALRYIRETETQRHVANCKSTP